MSRKTDSYKLRKWSILARRNCKGVCDCCREKVGFKFLEVHHKNCYRYFPLERFLQENAAPLCEDCHKLLHNTFKINYRFKTTNDDYQRFKKLVNYGQSKKERF